VSEPVRTYPHCCGPGSACESRLNVARVPATMRQRMTTEGALAKNAATIEQRIRMLRERLVSAKDFREPWNYFHDRLVGDKDFSSAGEPASNESLQDVLEATGSAVLRHRVSAEDFLPIHLPSHHFWHGALRFEALPGIFFYFDDVDVGLLGIPDPQSSRNTLYVRFSLAQVGSKGPVFPSTGGPRGKA
jgi:hypothetical protein